MKKLIERAIQCSTWVVVGATVHETKFGNKIYRRLKNAGYETLALNPVYDAIDGDPCYPSPVNLPKVPDCASMVVSPDKGRTLLQPLYDHGIRLLWFQPGAYDSRLLDEAAAIGFEIIYDYCVLIELNNYGR